MMPAHAMTDVRAAMPRIVVLQSIPPPDDTTNPYLRQLVAALPREVETRYYSLRSALFAHYDLFHVHWPEYLLRHPNRLRALLKRLGVGALLLRLWATGTPVVRTLHNLQPHEGGGWTERLLLRGLDRLTRRRICINAAGDDGSEATDTILHGHYRDWFAARPIPPTVPGRLLYFGLIRPYKGVEALLEAFGALHDSALPGRSPTLRVVGNPASDRMRAKVQAACDADPRVSALLRYVDDGVLAREIGEAQLVVLPYRQMHNSGALLLALSLTRPVLVPWSEANARLAKEVGPGWVRLYQDVLDAEALAEALRIPTPPGLPDLSRRDWPELGRQHHATYASALRAAKRWKER
ncbi:glycosyltransferase [Lysobacter sp. M2-1]|uniref:glycosyltransferase n=1 Tax=Lysobacter sp. M2-1 TaxID=2916839 RepID=UPI001F5A44AB|nr:glycosyltransferase [Lysobacter sp. M2-1]